MFTIRDAGSNREYKATVFAYLFGAEEYKQNALDLYNALNDSAYSNLEDLEIYTLSDALYMKMKNDVSFLIGEDLTLVEHQSTINPNMPLRGFCYFGEMYSRFISVNHINIYSTALKKIPTPRYVVLYNGMEKWENQKLRLSDAFMRPLSCPGDFEWTAEVININKEDEPLRKKCKVLDEYVIFIEKIQEYRYNLKLKYAIDRACEHCIKEGVLVDFLRAHYAEVNMSILTEYDEELYEKELKEEARKEGLAEGRAEGRAEMQAELDAKDEELNAANTEIARLKALLEEKK